MDVANRLKLNTDKTQLILLGTRQQLVKVKRKSVSLGGVDIPFSDDVSCLGVVFDNELKFSTGVVFDNELKFSTQIRRLTGKCFYHLRQMRSVRRSLSVDAAKALVNAFITSRIDYFNSVISQVTVTHLRPLQSVLNAAARLIVKKRKYDSIRATIPDVLLGYRFSKELSTSFVILCIQRCIILLQYI